MKFNLLQVFLSVAVLAYFVQADNILRIYIKSEGCDDPAIHGCGYATIRVNGVDYSKRLRGYNVVVVDGKTGLVESSASFDTFGDIHAASRLVYYLNGILPRKLVLVAIQDEGSKLMTTAGYIALKRVGATYSLNTFRHSYALLGWSGYGALDAVTQVQRDRYQGPSIISKILNTPL